RQDENAQDQAEKLAERQHSPPILIESFSPLAVLVHGLPRRVGIKARHRNGRPRSTIFFVNDARLIHEEGVDTANAVGSRPGDQRESSNHGFPKYVGMLSSGRVRTLFLQHTEIVAMV